MKKGLMLLVALMFSLALSGLCVAAVEDGKISVKAGDTVYVCSCGEQCACLTTSRKEGKCGCGKEMVKVTVSKVEDGKAYYLEGGKERMVATSGKYACACGPKCNCDTISQKPGKCGCGKEMMEVK